MNERLIELLRAVPVKDLIAKALEVRMIAYAPYSHYTVGAALITGDGKIYQGCNVENASYGVSNCAERTAFFKAVSEGYRQFRAIAITGSPEGHLVDQYAFPCGVCRQVMMEFCDPESFLVIVAKSDSDYKVYALKELLPEGFGPGNLE
ncbi:MAG: cytidine deaminase [Lachnospiraceae bacterium]|nr:cytidine deaminase [Lachnospiraceae bacterium]